MPEESEIAELFITYFKFKLLEIIWPTVVFLSFWFMADFLE